MSANLLDTFKEALNADFVAQVAARLGEPEPQLRAAVDGMLPVLLGGLVQRGTPEGVGALIKSIASVPADPLMLARPVSLLTEDTGALERLTTMGPGLLGLLFGSKANVLASAVGSVAGIRTSSASWLGAVLAPLACALLNREVHAAKLDDGGVQRLLAAQRETLQATLDRRILAAIGIPTLNKFLPDTAENVPATMRSAEPVAPPDRAPLQAPQPPRQGQPVVLWIVLGLIVLAVLGYFAAR